MQDMLSFLFPLIGFAVFSTLLIVFLKEGKLPAMALIVGLAAGVLIFLTILPQIAKLFSDLIAIGKQANISDYYFSTVFKIIGIAYLAEFGAQLCRDAGQAAIGLKVEFAAKVCILLMAMPIMSAILQSVLRLLS